ncbi:MAG: hypothetical protein WCY05_02980, partial [Candidatus Omnitrophota bacterium]
LLSRTFDSYVKSRLVQDKENFVSLLKSIDDEKRNFLCNFIPVLKEIFPFKEEMPKDSGVIFDVYWALIKTIVQHDGSIFLGINNIQYADLLSLDFLNFLLTKGKNSKIFLFLTALEPLPAGGYNPFEVKDIIGRMIANPDIKTIRLGTFSDKETEEVVDVVFPNADKQKKLSKIIFSLTKGHPFFIEELLKYLIEKSLVCFENNKWEAKDIAREMLPRSLEEVISQRIKGLDPDVKEVMLLSSVIGEDISPEILTRIKSVKEGNMLEILDKAKKLRLIKEEEDGFSFPNDIAKEITLKEIEPVQKKNFTNKVSEALMDLYKDNLETVSFQLGSIFSKSEETEKLHNFIQRIGEKTSKIFNSQEILKYLEDLSRVAEEEEKVIPVPEIAEHEFPLAVDFLRLLQGALKDSKLYPRGSKIRESAIDNVYESLVFILDRYEAITISEIEKSLIVNKRRVTLRLAKFIDPDYTVKFLIERDIKSFSLVRGITKEELSRFIEIIMLDPQDIYVLGKWKDILLQKKLLHVSVNKAVYMTPQGASSVIAAKDKIENAVLADFILGKISGKELGNMNLLSMLKNDPKILSDQLLKAVEAAKELDKYSDEVNVLAQGVEKIASLMDGGSKGIPAKDNVEIKKKLAEAFMNFSLKTKIQLIRRANSADNFVLNAMGLIDEKAMMEFLGEAFSSLESAWSLGKLVLKLYEAYTAAGKDLKAIVFLQIEGKAFSEEEKNVIKGEIEWGSLSLEKKVNDVYKMDKDVLSEISENEISSIIEGVTLSDKLEQSEKLFVYFRTKSLESPHDIGMKVKSAYAGVLKKIYAIADKKKAFFDALEVFISSIKADVTKADIDFSLSLLSSIIEDLNLYKFKRKGEYEKIKLFYDIHKFIDANKSYISDAGVTSLTQKLNFEDLAVELFNFYTEGGIENSELKDIENIVQYFSLLFLDKVIKSLVVKLAKIGDPFDRFLIIRRLQKFSFSLSKDDLEKLTNTILNSLQFDDVCDMLSYTKKEELVSVLTNLYPKIREEDKEKILNIAYRLKLKEILPFLKELAKTANSRQLQKRIVEIIDEIE